MKWTADRLPDLRGRTAIVTGANSGIGWHCSLALAARNARVVLACRNLQRGDYAVSRIREQVSGADVTTARLDLAAMASVREFVEN